MGAYKVLHIEDDDGCNWLLREKLKGKNILCQWISKKEETDLFLKNDELPDFVVCDGQIPYWQGHIAEILRLKPSTATNRIQFWKVFTRTM